jgi:hypothetical protein
MTAAMSSEGKRRDRSREGAGKSDASWKKHELLRRVTSGQVAAFRVKHPTGRILLIDGNAGDGFGVKQLQGDLFGENLSVSTAELVVQLGESLGNVDVVLCEKIPAKRDVLARRFPQVPVLKDHALAPLCIRRDHAFALWLSDPCGPAGQGVAHMRAVADLLPSDFIVVVNDGGIRRMAATVSPKWRTSRERYAEMIEPGWFCEALQRPREARTPLIRASNGFHYRIAVLSHHLSDSARRKPFEVIS